MRPPVTTCPRLAIAAIKRLLTKAGHPIAHRSGVYRPFVGNTQACTEGFRVTKLGCSSSVLVEYTMGYDARKVWRDHAQGARDILRANNAKARALLLARGYTPHPDYAEIMVITCQNRDPL